MSRGEIFFAPTGKSITKKEQKYRMCKRSNYLLLLFLINKVISSFPNLDMFNDEENNNT